MKKRLALLTALSMVMLGATNVQAQNLLTNGTLDATYDQEIVPAFFLPKPASWTPVRVFSR